MSNTSPLIRHSPSGLTNWLNPLDLSRNLSSLGWRVLGNQVCKWLTILIPLANNQIERSDECKSMMNRSNLIFSYLSMLLVGRLPGTYSRMHGQELADQQWAYEDCIHQDTGYRFQMYNLHRSYQYRWRNQETSIYHPTHHSLVRFTRSDQISR